ncbi:MAG: nucleoside triphosphate pyrophosphohydrolase [Chloroflexota bacterium]
MSSLQVLDPDEPFFFDPTIPVIVNDLESAERRQRAHAILRRSLRDTDALTLIDSTGAERDGCIADLLKAGPLRGVRVSPLPPMDARRSIAGARSIVARLRGPEGCPWDREQTPESLIRFVLEEAYEVADAIRHGTAAELADELGDLLLQVLLHSEIAQETGRFTFDDVLESLNEKLVRRHPHVFSDAIADSSAAVLKNWEQLKRAEKPDEPSSLDRAGNGQPALMAAQTIQRKARSAGFDWPPGGAWIKFEEELQELRDASAPDEVEHELGDVLFMAARIGLEHGIDAESALAGAMGRVRSRFGHVERVLRDHGREVHEASNYELEQLWAEAKEVEREALAARKKATDDRSPSI